MQKYIYFVELQCFAVQYFHFFAKNFLWYSQFLRISR